MAIIPQFRNWDIIDFYLICYLFGGATELAPILNEPPFAFFASGSDTVSFGTSTLLLELHPVIIIQQINSAIEQRRMSESFMEEFEKCSMRSLSH